jgi:thiamine pyrophosphate-dependent acetolactate synthase large subunit-like protein
MFKQPFKRDNCCGAVYELFGERGFAAVSNEESSKQINCAGKPEKAKQKNMKLQNLNRLQILKRRMKKTQKMVMSGYLASMGFGLPGALAAALAYSDRQVVCIAGDGGFSMVMGDFLTALKYKLPVKVFVLNNQSLGMIQQEQKAEGYQTWQTELYNYNFADFAEHSEGTGIKVTEPSELEAAVDRALSADKPIIVDIDTDPRRFI